MAELRYFISLEEHLLDKSGNVQHIYEHNLPHHKQIADWITKEWIALNPVQYFPNNLQNIIESCSMRVYRDPKRRTVAVIIVKPIPGFFWNKRTRAMVFEELDAQFSDGFGETIDQCSIPGVPEKYVLRI